MAVVRVTTHVSIVIAIVTAAAMAPGKAIDEVLKRPVVLEQEDMTLSEIEDYSIEYRYERVPLMVYFNDNGDDVVHFTATELTLNEFIQSIESQTGMRHHFGYCGNATTVRWGPGYNFGLSFAHPDDRSGPD